MKGKNYFLFLSIWLLSYCYSFGQGEAARWYFGFNAGMNFSDMHTRNNVTINGTANQPLSAIPRYTAGPINTSEGCFSISDEDGNFLFASDGRSVYNRDMALMPHGQGLKGHGSATQSGIFIPRPGYPNQYYIVTAPASEDLNSRSYGLNYYLVNLTLDGGKGDVVGPYDGSGYPVGTKLDFGGIYQEKEAFENIAAVGHSNGTDFWLVHRCRKRFFVWKVTSTGIHKNSMFSMPFDYDIGYEPVPLIDPGGNIDSYHSHGYLKFSADGKYIACANPHQYNDERSSIAIGEFDTTTGEITNIKNHLQLAADGYGSTAYGLAFSPDNKYLYYACWWTGPLYRVSVNSLINGTAETPYKVSDWVTNVQMGPDNRLYGITSALRPTPWRDLFVVLDPNSSTPDVAVIPDYFPATTTGSPRTGSHLSFPTFVSSFFSASDIEISPSPACMNNEITFSVRINAGSGTNRVEKFEWDFGDGSAVSTENDMNQYEFISKHTYTKTGIFKLTIIPYRKDLQGTFSVIEDKVKSFDVKVDPCVMPVNPNIHLYN